MVTSAASSTFGKSAAGLGHSTFLVVRAQLSSLRSNMKIRWIPVAVFVTVLAILISPWVYDHYHHVAAVKPIVHSTVHKTVDVCAKVKQWIHDYGYEYVHNAAKGSQKAVVERCSR